MTTKEMPALPGHCEHGMPRSIGCDDCIIQSLAERVRELEKDAARYGCIVRNLHLPKSPLHEEWNALDKILDHGGVPTKQQFDAAIDAAIGKEGVKT